MAYRLPPLCGQHITLNGILSYAFPVKDGVSRGSVLGPDVFLIFMNDISDSLKNIAYICADDSLY